MRKDVLVRLAGLAIMLTLISSALVSGPMRSTHRRSAVRTRCAWPSLPST
jgi:hypothetical protein